MSNHRPANVEKLLDRVCDVAIDAHFDAVALADEKERLTATGRTSPIWSTSRRPRAFARGFCAGSPSARPNRTKGV